MRPLIYLILFLFFFPGCGQTREAEKGRHLEIFNGTTEQNPKYLSIGWIINEEAEMCSGILIRNDIVLTAGHCLVGAAFQLYFEIDRPKNNGKSGKKYFVKGKSPWEDIGIVMLRDSFDLPTDQLFPLSERDLSIGTIGTVLGYGDTGTSADNGPVPVRRSGTMKFSGYSSDFQASGTMVFSPTTSGQMPCIGDSGGPMIIESSGQPSIAALVQGGKGFIGPPKCGSASKNFFASIYKNLGWIKTTISTL